MMTEYEEKPQDEDSMMIDPKLAELQESWIARIDKAEKAAEPYREEVKRALKWLRLDKDSRKNKSGGGKLNIAFANYEVLRSTVYSRPPQTVVQPRFGGGPLRAQLGAISEVIERAVSSETERRGLHSALKLARDELLKAARGVVWVRYQADLIEQEQGEPPEVEMANPEQEVAEVEHQSEPLPKIKAGERVAYDVITWRNFIHGPAARWEDVPWVARGEDMSSSEIRERFDLDKAEQAALGLNFTDDEAGKDAPKTSEGSTCRVYEVWCKKSRKVYFVARGARQLIEPPSPPLINVEGFFPCPEPAMSITQDGEVRPIPDVVMIEDQLVSIDRLTKRIIALEDAVKVRGFYPKGATDTTAADAIEEAVKSNDDRQVIIPVPAFAAGNGSKLDLVWLPLDVVVQAITTLRQQRQEAIELVYQVTGISDVMRGASEASETLGAQQIKDRWGGVRVRDKQEEMRRMARDLCRITAEVICELFEPENIASAAVYGFDMQMMQTLRDDRTRSLVIDVETDSTIQADEQEEKQRATELATTIGNVLTQGVQAAQAAPELVPLIGATLKHVVQRHRAGREMESVIEQAVQALTNKAQQPPQPPPPPPEKVKAESDQAIAKMRAEVDMRGQDIDASLKAREQDMKAAQVVQPQIPFN